MAHTRHLSQAKGIRLFYTPESPSADDTVFLHATVFDSHGFPVGQDQVRTVIGAPRGPSEQLDLQPVEGGWGLFEGQFTPRHNGAYSISVNSEKTGHQLKTEVMVKGLSREKVGVPARSRVLQDIARITDGSFSEAAGLDEIVAAINVLPQATSRQVRYKLWMQWWWAGLLIGLCAVFWTLRKVYGLV
jgi:hypothetical protein